MIHSSEHIHVLALKDDHSVVKVTQHPSVLMSKHLKLTHKTQQHTFKCEQTYAQGINYYQGRTQSNYWKMRASVFDEFTYNLPRLDKVANHYSARNKEGSTTLTATHIHTYNLQIHTRIIRACACNAVVAHSRSLLTLNKGPAALCWYGEMRKQNCVLDVRHEIDGLSFLKNW